MREKYLRELKDSEVGPQQLFYNACLFTVLSIQQPIVRLGGDWGKFYDGDYGPLWGFKRRTIEYLSNNGADVCDRVRDIYHQPGGPPLAIYEMCRVPGFGPVKASFVLQLMGYPEACLDVHNLRQLGLSESHFKPRKWTADTYLQKIKEYRATWHNHMPADQWWDEWCITVADNYDLDPIIVSDLHHIVLEEDREWPTIS